MIGASEQTRTASIVHQFLKSEAVAESLAARIATADGVRRSSEPNKQIVPLTPSEQTATHGAAMIGRMDAYPSGLSDVTRQATAATVIAETRDWIEKAVIGLNLCPFAKTVYVNDRIRYCVSEAQSEDALLADLSRELRALHGADPQTCETALLIHPRALTDFLEYNDFLGAAEATVEALGLTGELQIASFHPRYQFAGSGPDDIENYTNRSPYPMLHLLRESSVERAAAATPDVAAIPARNMETLRRLGFEGWRRLWLAEPGDS